MKVKVTLARTNDPDVDLAITCDASATVCDLAGYLYAADPVRHRVGGIVETPQSLTLSVTGDAPETIDGSLPVAESGLRSGSRIRVSRGGEAFRAPSSRGVATLTVSGGPDQGKTFALSSGSNVVGRSRNCDVRLTDPMVSRQHVRVNVTSQVEVVDLGSANGVAVEGEPQTRAVLRPADRVFVGDTVFTVRLDQATGTKGRTERTAVGFIRSPRLVAVVPGREFEAPEVPERPQPQRFPILMMVAPVLMGLALYWFTKQVQTLLFMALSPIMMVGNYLENVFSSRSLSKRSLKAFRADVQTLVAEAETYAQQEVASRLIEHPSTVDCLDAIRQGTSLMWTRRREDPGFGEFRLGLGRCTSRSTVKLPEAKRAPRDVYAELVSATSHLAHVDGVPVVGRPELEGALGVAGPRSAAVATARAIVVQAIALHSPHDLTVVALASPRTSSDWEWLKWLPHCAGVASPISGRHLTAQSADATSLVGELEDLLAHRAAKEGPASHVVLVVVESDAPVEFGRLVDLAERGKTLGVLVLWVADDVTQLPAACRTFVELTSFTASHVGFVHNGDLVTPVMAESIGLADVESIARVLSPMVDLTIRSRDDSDLPRSVGFLGMTDLRMADEPMAVIERWSQNRSILTGPYAPNPLPRKAGSLRAVVGASAGDVHALDLRADGPHALVGGTTGSGKSELLQTWILSMAASHSPERLNFLLVDYKGGAAFAECNDLPHTVGLVTDLNQNGVRRALTSLGAELTYREHVLEKHKAKDLVSLEKRGIAGIPPSLVLVVDEFAALVTEVPDFVDGVVNIAQRGRSLGIHLILATQRPQGVIKDNLRANTNLRLALRMADEDDSTDVLGVAEAAFFDQDLPGRAVSKTGPGRLVPFQTAYVGGHTGSEAPPPDIHVEELSFGSASVWEPDEEDRPELADPGPTDIARVVETVVAAAGRAGLPTPRRPWLDDLRTHYDMSDLTLVPTSRRDDELVFGVLDDPNHQSQPTIAFYPDRDGSMVVYGAGGTGKSTLLRSLAVAAGFTVRGGPCHVYGLDFSSRGLAMLEKLPHVGSIINGSDDERVERLIRWLRNVVDERAGRYAGKNAGTIAEYRRLAGQPDETRILLLVDGLPAFRQAYETTDRFRLFDMFTSIATDGRAVGVHVVLSSDQRTGLTTALGSSVQRRIVLRMADPDDYGLLGAPSDILSPESPPGRGISDGYEIQVAILGKQTDSRAQANAIAEFAHDMVDAGARQASPIRRLPEVVRRAELPPQPGQLVLGMESEAFGALATDPSGVMLIAGPPGSGRSTALRVVLDGLRELPGVTECHLFTDRRAGLAVGGEWATCAIGQDDVSDKAVEIASRLREINGGSPRQVVVLEAAPDFANSMADYALVELVKAAINNGHTLICEGETSALSTAHGFLSSIKAGRRGICLQPDTGDGYSIFQTQFPKLNKAEFPPGRGIFIERGKMVRVQFATD